MVTESTVRFLFGSTAKPPHVPTPEECLEMACTVADTIAGALLSEHHFGIVSGYIVATASNATDVTLAKTWWEALKLHDKTIDDEFIATSILGG